MADIGLNLKIKYGLSRDATAVETRNWYQLVESYRRSGYSLEESGELAARSILPGYRTRVYASEADTIEMLLDQAKNK